VNRYDIDSLDNRDPEVFDKVIRWIGPILKCYFRAEVFGLERIPSGPGLYVGNHNSGLVTPEIFILGDAVYQMYGLDDVPYGLAHEVTLKLPVSHPLLIPLGAVRASHQNAHRLFEQGRKVLVYPGGDLDSFRPFRHRNRIVFGERRGYIRLALRGKVPIIPVVCAGAHSTFIVLDDMRGLAHLLRLDKLFRTKVAPLVLSIPWGITLGPYLIHVPYPSKILMELLEPIRFERTGRRASNDESYVQECAQKVEVTMQIALERLAERRRQKLQGRTSACNGT